MKPILLLGAAVLSSAFKNTSPHFISCPHSAVNGAPKASSFLSSTAFEELADSAIASCSSNTYIVIHQPGIHASDFRFSKASPHLKRALGSQRAFEYPYVHGDSVNLDHLQEVAINKCGAGLISIDPATGSFTIMEEGEAQVPKFLRLELDPLPADRVERMTQLADNDRFLNTLLSSFEDNNGATIVYTSSPPLHVPLARRDVAEEPFLGNSTLPIGGLFKRYQYFTPGLFMGLLTGIILFSMLAVALRAISSIEISYHAFDRQSQQQQQQKK